MTKFETNLRDSICNLGTKDKKSIVGPEKKTKK